MLLYPSWKINRTVIHLTRYKTILTAVQSPLSFWTLLRTESFAGSISHILLVLFSHNTCLTPA